MSNELMRDAFGHAAALCTALSEIYTQWCVRGPSLEASSAIAAMSQEHAGYSKMLDRLAEGATPDISPVPSLRRSPSTWPELIGVSGTAELALAAAVDEWRRAAAGSATRNLTKMAQEMAYHARFFRGWFQEFDGDTSQAGDLFRRARGVSEPEVQSWLATSGIEPAATLGGSAAFGGPEDPSPEACPLCGALETRVLSSFGPSLMTSQLKCGACGHFFEAVRWSPEPMAGSSGVEAAEQGRLRL